MLSPTVISWVIAMVGLTSPPVPPAGRSDPPSEAEIRALVAAQAEAWNRSDAAAWASPFAPAATFINIRGAMFDGRPAIEGITSRIFATVFSGTHDSVTVPTVTMVTPDVAVAQYEHAVSGYTTLPPGIVSTVVGADGAGVLRTRMTYVLQRGADRRWTIVHGQNTAILPTRSAT